MNASNITGSNNMASTELKKAEWKVRTELAAAYRLVALFGWDDLVFTHLSARVPGPEHHFLINPYGLLFHEITASSLVKVDQEGQVVQAGGLEHAGQAVQDGGFVGLHGGGDLFCI